VRLKRLNDQVELPEKTNNNKYINVRSAVRIDVRPGETVEVPTGVAVSLAKEETAYISGPNVVPTELPHGKYKEIIVPIYNDGDRNLLIYPGQVIATISVERKKKATIVTKATLVQKKPTKSEYLDSASTEAGFHEKPCGGCP